MPAFPTFRHLVQHTPMVNWQWGATRLQVKLIHILEIEHGDEGTVLYQVYHPGERHHGATPARISRQAFLAAFEQSMRADAEFQRKMKEMSNA